MSHTPGPFSVGRDPFDIVSADDHRVARALPGGIFIPGTNRYRELTDDEQRDNARLFAAAPDLLEVLNLLTGYVIDNNPGAALADAYVAGLIDAANTAIAKATGGAA